MRKPAPLDRIAKACAIAPLAKAYTDLPDVGLVWWFEGLVGISLIVVSGLFLLDLTRHVAGRGE